MSELDAPPLVACPFLPHAPEVMDWTAIRELGEDRGEEFFLRCLTYGNYLWVRRLAARAILAVDRGLLSAVKRPAQVLEDYPLPYRAIGWMLREVPANLFIGNPRVHYQHLADRVRGERENQRRWRAWACWHLVRLVRPDLEGDPRHDVAEPTSSEIETALAKHGIQDEVEWWQQACTEFLGTASRTPSPGR